MKKLCLLIVVVLFVPIFSSCSKTTETSKSSIYQMLYASSDLNRSEYVREREGIEAKNMYDNYVFSLDDAQNWLKQTGGNINFVLQMRHPTYFPFDDVNLSAQLQYDMISKFLEAHKILTAKGIKLKIPTFFTGALEKEPTTDTTYINENYKEHSGLAIYKLICEKLEADGYDTNMLSGIYVGEESINPDNVITTDRLREVCTYIHRLGKKIIWIPYSTEGNVEEYKNILLKDVDDDGRPAYDIVFMQYCTFFWLKNDVSNAKEETTQRINKISDIRSELQSWLKEHDIKVGIHMEFDMGLSIGRTNERTDFLNMSPTTKREVFGVTMDIAKQEIKDGMPIGLYSGGPNEQGYNDIMKNHNTHNIGYYSPYVENYDKFPPDESWSYHHKPYNEFDNAYDGNLIYDINEYIFNDKLSEKLKSYLY